MTPAPRKAPVAATQEVTVAARKPKARVAKSATKLPLAIEPIAATEIPCAVEAIVIPPVIEAPEATCAVATLEAPATIETAEVAREATVAPAPPAAPAQARPTPSVLVFLARLWSAVGSFIRGPGLRALVAGFKSIGILFKKTWVLLASQIRPSEPESVFARLGGRGNPVEVGPQLSERELALQAMYLAGRIPPHQRHLFAHTVDS